MHKVKVRWIDGFEKYYDCSDFQFGKDNYWLKLSNGKEKWIPKEYVRHVTTEEYKAATKACGVGQQPNTTLDLIVGGWYCMCR